MLIPTALMKPTITAFDTKRSTEPSFSRPATSMTIPVSTESVNRVRAALRASCTASTSATTMAIAPVPCTTMNVDEVSSAPVTVPKR